ncbi:hypothetical protein [Paenibacillus sp. PL2-23]|uniref:hypothetical protein n=1 Tax=Paenibacillus sp. PL2-23 TaxID=2100729 RepID=UPI0030F952AE
MPNQEGQEAQAVPAANQSWTLWLVLAFASAAAILLAMLLMRPQASAADAAATRHTFEGGQLLWELEAYPAKVLAPNTFRLTLTDTEGEPLRGAALSIKLEMLDMLCGDYHFQLSESLPGVYMGEGIPLMAGLWRATMVMEGADEPLSRTFRAEY